VIGIRVLAVSAVAALGFAPAGVAAPGNRPPPGLTYVRVSGGGEIGGPVASTVRMTVGGGRSRRLFPGAGPLEWAPDGTRLLFTRLGSNGYSLFVAHTDGTSIRRLARGTSTGGWLAGSRTVVYSRLVGPNRYAVYRLALDARATPRELFVLPGVPVWSPNGRSLVYASGEALMIAGDDAGNAHPLAKGSSSLVSWSPDGEQVAYTRNDSICVTRIATRATHCFTPAAGGAAPTWTPDGSRLVYSRGNGSAIASARPDGSDRHDLLTIGTSAVRLETPAWEPRP